MLRGVARDRSEWAGIPTPIAEHKLILEPRYPLQALGDIHDKEALSDWTSVNQWYSRRLRGNIVIGNKDGRRRAFLEPCQQIDMLIGTLTASFVWRLEAEQKACLKLAKLIAPHLFRAYLIAGAFIETSKRSGVTYIFRRLRPTIALRPHEDSMRVLCALCLHPIGYYSGTWAGAMVPTDDVLAHLLMMRGNEPKYWAHANQHPVYAPQAGI